MSDLFKGLKNLGADLAAEGKRLGIQGTMELASALFNGHGFVPYGPGQYTPSIEHGKESRQAEQVQERGGREE